jgi:hypothetical protein
VKTQARFIVRPADEEGKQGDLMVGSLFKGASELKPNYIYEIVEIMGVLTLKELGESSMTKNAWMREYAELMVTHKTQMTLTKREIDELAKKGIVHD